MGFKLICYRIMFLNDVSLSGGDFMEKHKKNWNKKKVLSRDEVDQEWHCMK